MKVKVVVLIIVWLSVSLALAPEIDSYNQSYLDEHFSSDYSFLVRFLGEAESILSSLSILQADLYYHGGVGHFYEDHAEGFAIGDPHYHAETHGEGTPDHDQGIITANPFNFLPRIYRALNVTKHVHLGNNEIKEIIPWLYYAAMVDPHNVQAFTLAGYYLSDRLGKVEEGIKFLRKGLSSNPESWEIYAEIGYIYFKQRDDYEVALRYLMRAWKLLGKTPHDKFQERFVLTLLANSYEKIHQDKKAYPIYVYLDRLFPDSGIFDKKIKDLKEE